jgi:hypothetical protein
MKKLLPLNLFLIGLSLLVNHAAGADAAKQPSYKESIADNPTAEADIAVVTKLMNSLIEGNFEQARTLLAPGFKSAGPSPDDNFTAEQALEDWKGKNARQTDRKVSFVANTFRVTTGKLKGNWVSTWGNYTFTQNGKTITVPYQYTARVKDGQIEEDRIYYDKLYILLQLGHTLRPPGKK